MGSDMLRSLTSWYRPESICALAALVCICRAGEQGGEEAAAEQLKLLYNARVKLLPPVRQLSSTEIRKRLWEAKPVSALVPPAVERYIYENGLYMGEDIALTTQKLRSSLKESRFRHVIGVEITAIALADRLGADGERARLAALLHDCAKGLSEEEQYALALLDGDDGLMPTDVAAVVHAPAGAVLARKEYGVTDEEVLKAIRYHTTGEKSMSLLDKILWAADLIEPGRSYPGADRLRKELLNVETPEEFDRALALAFKENLCYIQKNNSILHPATLRAYEDLIKRTKERN